MTIVPYQHLRPETLRRLIEDFVTREGAIHGHDELDAAEKIAAVQSQLRSGKAVILFDQKNESFDIAMKDRLPPGCGTVQEQPE
jgi:hypothetical protein